MYISRVRYTFMGAGAIALYHKKNKEVRIYEMVKLGNSCARYMDIT